MAQSQGAAMYTVAVREHYESAHALRDYHGEPEELHGHSFMVEVALETEELRDGGMAFDFVEVNAHLGELTQRLDHRNLNEVEPFTEIEPSAENQARYFYDELAERLPASMADALAYVRVWETAEQWAQYSERRP